MLIYARVRGEVRHGPWEPHLPRNTRHLPGTVVPDKPQTRHTSVLVTCNLRRLPVYTPSHISPVSLSISPAGYHGNAVLIRVRWRVRVRRDRSRVTDGGRGGVTSAYC